MARPPKGTDRIPISQLAELASRSSREGADPRRPQGPVHCRVLGIDPGSRVTGYGVVEIAGNTLTHIASGAIKAMERRDTLFEDRLVTIHTALQAVIREHRPQVASIEGVFTHRNAQSALKLGQARGAVMLTARLAGLDIAEYPPSRIKQAIVGYGKADKTQVQKMITLLLGIPAPEMLDTSDALAIAICHLHSIAPSRMFGA